MRIGVDVGGTFTDGVAVDDRGHAVAVRKEPSTPPRVEEGATATIASLTAGTGPAAQVVHGTTAATNALIERRTGRVGLLTTEGFRDVLAVGTQSRPDLYDVMQQKPRPLVPRSLSLEASERMAPDGSVVRPLDEGGVARAARRFRQERVEAVAVSFLFSYVNPEHERRAGEILRRLLPGIEVALSSEVAPLIREYPRTSTTVINAALRPVLSRYLRELEARAAAPVLVMQSNGGVLPAGEAASHGHLLLRSGPAGGVVGATVFGAARGVRDLVTMDMGGTSFETCLVLGGRPAVRGESAAEGQPVLASTLDLETVGAGGGSLAWVDQGGALRVGPQSAGAVPGPACYGQGGTRPTVTDANLVIGRVNPTRFLDGRLPLDVEAADLAIRRHLAEPLGIGVEGAARAIIEVATATMARTLRVVTVGRGWDPAGLPLVAFGGAGPMHAARVAEELGTPRVLVPPLPGFISAIGLLATDLRSEVAETVLRPGRREMSTSALSRAVARLGRAAARRLGTDPGRAVLSLAVDCRYLGQGFELTVPLPAPTTEGIDEARRAFHAQHDAAYGHAAPEEPVEIVALRVTATAPGPRFRPARINRTGSPASVDARKVFDGDDWVEAPVFDRGRLPRGWSMYGPAIVEEGESTTWVPAGWSLAVDPFGSLELTRG